MKRIDKLPHAVEVRPATQSEEQRTTNRLFRHAAWCAALSTVRVIRPVIFVVHVLILVMRTMVHMWNDD